MERLFCNGKKAFCENPGGCRDCDYADGSGAADEHTISALLSALFGEGYNLDRLRELVKADREGRIAILSEPMKPMVYKPNDTDVYCPNCGETLSGGWPLSDADDCRKIYQCFYCGQSIDTEKCVPYESDLKERENDV